MKPPPFDTELAEDLRTLQQVPQWLRFVEVATKMMNTFRSELTNIKSGDSMEKIAIERIRYTSMISGIQILFFQIEELITELNKREKKDEDEDARGDELDEPDLHERRIG